MSRVTVVQIITQLELGGAQEIALFTCRNLDRRRFAVHLITGRGGLLDVEAGRIPDMALHFDNDLVREVRPMPDLRCLRSLRRRLKEIRRQSSGPMIVQTHSSKAGILGRWAARGAGADRVVHTIHGFGFYPSQPWPLRRTYQAAEQLTAAATHAFVAVSKANLQVAERLGLLRGGKPSIVLPGWLDPEEYEAGEEEGRALRRELDIPLEAPLVGMLACLKPQKSPIDFVRVAARVRAAHPGTRFLIAGDGVLRPQVEAEIDRLGLHDAFHLLGWRRDVGRLLAAIDVLVLTSLWEGLPRVIPQAMVARKPVVASRVDGIPEAVEDGRSGFLVEPRDIDGFAERIGRLIADPALAHAAGEAGHRRLEEFSARAMLEKLERFYDRLLADR